MKYIEPLSRLIAAFSKLPSVGEKTAARYAYAVLNSSDEDVAELADAIATLKSNVHFCSVCGNFTEHDVCDICATRSPKTICVVKEPRDITALEKVKDFKGVYHVLHGVISPMEKIGPNDIRIKELLARLTPDVEEVILATNPDVEGEATAMYIARLVKPLGVKVTRIARGLPEGSVIEYADESTLSRALSSRIEL
jgi:recombination protein RecR